MEELNEPILGIIFFIFSIKGFIFRSIGSVVAAKTVSEIFSSSVKDISNVWHNMWS